MARLFTRQEPKRASIDPTQWPVCGATCDGLKVDSRVPNTGSIASTLTNYEVLQGIREVPISVFSTTDLFYAKDDRARVRDLASSIEANGWVSPLIVVVDPEGTYVLEGGHRLAAAAALKKTSVPALVVVDGDSQRSVQAAGYAKSWIAPGPISDDSYVDVPREHAFTASDICEDLGIAPEPGASPERECEIPLLRRGWIRAGFSVHHCYFEVGQMTQASLEAIQSAVREDPRGEITVEDTGKTVWECSVAEFLAVNTVADLTHYRHSGCLVRGSGRRARLFTRTADTGQELAMAPVDPRRERMDEPDFPSDDARASEPNAVQGSKRPALFTRRALVEMHRTPPKGAPRPAQRDHLDEDFKAELEADKDPDLIRHTTGKSSGRATRDTTPSI